MYKIIIIFLLIFFSTPSFAQWRVKTNENEYTLEKESILTYTNSKKTLYAVYFPDIDKIRIAYYFEGIKYFDQTWNAILYNNGVLSSKHVYASFRVINSDRTYHEFADTYLMCFTDFDNAGDLFGGYLDIEIDPDLLKKGQYLTARIENPFIDAFITLKISLTGFTAAYNRANNNN